MSRIETGRAQTGVLSHPAIWIGLVLGVACFFKPISVNAQTTPGQTSASAPRATKQLQPTNRRAPEKSPATKSALAKSARSKTEPCWEILQTSLLAGKFRVICSKRAYRIESLGNRYVVVSKAPEWKVSAFNPLSKTIYESDVRSFKGNFAMGTGALGGYLENLPILRAPQKPTKYLAESAFKLHVENPRQAQVPKKTPTKNFNSVFFNTGDIASADYWTWNRTDVPTTLPIVLNKIYKLPVGKDFPLKLLTLNTEHETHVELETSAIRQIPLDPTIFDAPSNFKAVSEDIEIANDRRRQNSVKNLINNWDDWGRIVDTGK